jgi:hypothetical protein
MVSSCFALAASAEPSGATACDQALPVGKSAAQASARARPMAEGRFFSFALHPRDG